MSWKIVFWFVFSGIAGLLNLATLLTLIKVVPIDWQLIAILECLAILALWARGLLRGTRWVQGLER